MSKIYDCFTYFNETDLLEARLEYLNDIVDFFVIVESNKTYSGLDKELNFPKNMDRFKKYESKIIYRVVDTLPTNYFNGQRTDDIIKNKILDMMARYTHYPHDVFRYDVETYQREYILYILKDCVDDDIILISDLDEFPNKQLITKENIPENSHINFGQQHHNYYVDVIKPLDAWYYGTKMFYYSYIKNFTIGLSGLRMSNRTQGVTLEDSGWHFSWLGGVDSIINKLAAGGHQEYNISYVINNIRTNLKNNTDVFLRPNQIYIQIDKHKLPNDLVVILEKYPIFWKENDL